MTYVPGRSVEEIQRELGLDHVVKLGSNENPLGVPPAALRALREADADAFRYPGVEADDLRAAIAARVGVEIGNVVVGNGSCDVITSALRETVTPGSRVVVPRPYFKMYEIGARWYGAEIDFVDHVDYAFDLEAMARAVSARTRVVFLTNPNNPTGLIVPRDALTAFLDAVPPDVLVVLDEAYREFADEPGYPDGIQEVVSGRNVLVTRTFSKIYGLAGLRVGYGVGPVPLVTAVRGRQPPFHTGRPALLAALAAYGDEPFFHESRRVNAEGRVQLARGLESLGLRVLPSQANHVLVVGFDDASAVDRALLERGVIVRDTGPSFDLPGCLRVTVGTAQENGVFLEALAVIVAERHRVATPPRG